MSISNAWHIDINNKFSKIAEFAAITISHNVLVIDFHGTIVVTYLAALVITVRNYQKLSNIVFVVDA